MSRTAGEVSYGQLAHAALIRATFAEGQEYLLTSWDLSERPCSKSAGAASVASSSSASDAPLSRRSIEQWKGFLHATNDLFKTMTGGPATAMHFALEPASPASAAASSAGLGSCLDPCHEMPVPPGLQRTAVFIDFPRVLLVLAFGGFLPIDDAVARAQRVFELMQQQLGGDGFTLCAAGPGAKPLVAAGSADAASVAAAKVHACARTCCSRSRTAAADGLLSADGSDKPVGSCGADCRCNGPVWDRSPEEDTALRDGLMAAFDSAAASAGGLSREGIGHHDPRPTTGPTAWGGDTHTRASRA